MADERFKSDANFKSGGVVGGYSSSDAIGATSVTLIAFRLDPITGRLLVDANATIDHNITGMADGVKTVTSAGTDVALAASTTCKKVTIQAQTDNTGLIAVGATGVDATEATGTGIILYPGDAYEFEIDNLADVFIDSSVSGEGVRFTYFT